MEELLKKTLSAQGYRSKRLQKIWCLVVRGITFFVLFCALFILGYFFKRVGKVFEGDKLINWTFLTEDPQTLHVIDVNGTELKLSSKEYYSLKDKKTVQQWSKFLKQPKFPLYLKDLNQSLIKYEWMEFRAETRDTRRNLWKKRKKLQPKIFFLEGCWSIQQPLKTSKWNRRSTAMVKFLLVHLTEKLVGWA